MNEEERPDAQIARIWTEQLVRDVATLVSRFSGIEADLRQVAQHSSALFSAIDKERAERLSFQTTTDRALNFARGSIWAFGIIGALFALVVVQAWWGLYDRMDDTENKEAARAQREVYWEQRLKSAEITPGNLSELNSRLDSFADQLQNLSVEMSKRPVTQTIKTPPATVIVNPPSSETPRQEYSPKFKRLK